ncbi:hypothetical protein MVEN_01685300 [Mycena venus]|uniref:Uncharacterized protein n=1 Tax=Mycena venus TaxID=2733690 RepID=A0A8H7CPY2_9AGAR|nr:hypothetical protein MVEN_01685300 [Mycena venus]
MEDADDLKLKGKKQRKAKVRQKRKLDKLLSHGTEIPAWAEEGSEDNNNNEVQGGERGRESRREVSWIWTAAGSSGTDAEFEDALRINATAAGRIPLAANFAGVGGKAVGQEGEGGADRNRLARGGIRAGEDCIHLKQEALFLGLAARARETKTAPKLARDKKWPRQAVVDPLAEVMWGNGRTEEDMDGDDDGVLLAAADEGDLNEEWREVESDEEVIMGGELDDV